MKRVQIALAAVIALGAFTMSVDAHGRFGRRCRPCYNPCEMNCQPQYQCLPQQAWGNWKAPGGGYGGGGTQGMSLYYCVNGVWKARAMGTDIIQLRNLAARDTSPVGAYHAAAFILPPPRQAPIEAHDMVSNTTNASCYCIAPLGTLDGRRCACDSPPPPMCAEYRLTVSTDGTGALLLMCVSSGATVPVYIHDHDPTASDPGSLINATSNQCPTGTKDVMFGELRVCLSCP